MNLRTFQKFDPWETHRLAWGKKPGEAPPPAPAGAPTPPARTPEADAAARAHAEAEGQARAAAAQRTDRAPEQADAELDAALGGSGAAAQAPAAPRETAETAEHLPLFSDIMKIIKKPAAERTAEEKKICEAVEFTFYEITQKEQDEFKTQYTKEGKLDLQTIATKIRDITFTTKEMIIFMSLISDADIEELTKNSGLTAEQIQHWKEVYQSLQAKLETKRKLDRFDELVKKPEYANEYKKFKESIAQAAEKSPEELEKIKQDFLAVFKDPRDKEIVEWGINTEPSAFEKAYVLKNKLKGTKLTDEDIRTQLSEGTLNFREAQIAMALNHERAPEAESQIPDSVKGLGFMAILEKLIDQLSKLAEKISGALEKAFAKKDQPSERPRHFAKSPFGEENGNPKRITIARIYESGKGVEITATPDTPIFAVGGGTVKDLGNNKVELVADNGRKVVYQNIVIEASVNGTKVNAGTKIGKTGPQQTLTLQFFNEKGGEENPEPLLANFTTEKPVAQAPTQAPPASASAPAAEPAPKAAATPAPAPAAVAPAVPPPPSKPS